MRVKLMALAVTSAVLVAGCGTTAGGKVSELFGVTLDKNGKPYVMSATERQLARFGVLGTNEACADCEVTGGGNGKDASFACDYANFGLAAVVNPDGKVNGTLNFIFDADGGAKEYHLLGPVDFVRCIEIYEGEKGDTYGTVEFGGPLRHETGLVASDSYTFVCRVQDYGEPNRDDDFQLTVYDSNGNVDYSFSCSAEDGNIQIHPTRYANL